MREIGKRKIGEEEREEERTLYVFWRESDPLENVLNVKFYRKGEPLSEKERISDSVCEKISLSFSLFSRFLSN
jgi:hypothetical protein